MLKIILAATLIAFSLAQTCNTGTMMKTGTTELTGSYMKFSFNNLDPQDVTSEIVIGEDDTFFLTISLSGAEGGCSITRTMDGFTYTWNGDANWSGESSAVGGFIYGTTYAADAVSQGWCLINFGGNAHSLSFRSNSDVAGAPGQVEFLTVDKQPIGCQKLVHKDGTNTYTVFSYAFTGAGAEQQFPYYMNISKGDWTLDNLRLIMSAGVDVEPTAPVAPPVAPVAPSSEASSLIAVTSAVVGAVVAALIY